VRGGILQVKLDSLARPDERPRTIVLMAEIPGTVSQILWHFTGGPTWNLDEKHQNSAPKPAAGGYAALVGILKTQELRLGTYKEVVKVRVPALKVRNPKTKKIRTERDVIRTLTSCPVCCLADIPIMHLSYHAARYGKFAIGFHREAAIRHGFNPVFYTLHHAEVIRTIRQGFAKIRALDLENARDLLSYVEYEVDDAEADIDIDHHLWDLRNEIRDIETAVTTAKTSIAQFLAYVKTFESNEFQTVYCEREWRAVNAFSFTFEDVAMIVLPEKVGTKRYFEPFVSKTAKRLGLPRAIPIVPWETLLES